MGRTVCSFHRTFISVAVQVTAALSSRNLDTGTREKGWREAISGRTTARARVGEEKRFFKVFTKAGQPGWAALIPFYSAYILTKIAGRPGWRVLMLMIPFVNLAFGILLAIDIAKAFGQGAAFGVVLLFLLSGIGYLILGFGEYRYVGATELMPVTA
jgi:Family of unknown function (DUF5684)